MIREETMSVVEHIRQASEKIAHDFVNGQVERSVDAYKTLFNENKDLIQKLVWSDVLYRTFHINAAVNCTCFDILESMAHGGNTAFIVDVKDFTFGATEPVTINEIAVDHLNRVSLTDGGNRAVAIKQWESTLSVFGYTDKTAPTAALYVASFVLRDYLETQLFVSPGQAIIDIGSNIGLVNLFYLAKGFKNAYLIDTNDAALDAGRHMVTEMGLSNIHYLRPDDVDIIPHDTVDLIYSFRSWAFKYPFEEYEDLFLKCLKPGLAVCLTVKPDYALNENSAVVKKATKRLKINATPPAPTQLLKF